MNRRAIRRIFAYTVIVDRLRSATAWVTSSAFLGRIVAGSEA